MHLALDEESEQLRGMVKSFAKDRLRAKCRDWDEAGAIPADALDEGWGLSILAAGLPAAFGGAAEKDDAAPSALTNAIALEELSWGDLGFAQALFAANQLAVPVALYGSADEKKALLPLFTQTARPKATAAWIEPARTFDLGAIRSRAEMKGGEMQLMGTKTFVTGGDASDKTLVYARAGASSGFDGVDAWLVDGKDVSGLTRGAREDAMGPRAVTLSRFELAGVPATKLGAKRGVDYRALASRALVASAAAAVGVSRAAWEYAAGYAKERVAFGRPIAQYQSIAFKIADAATDTEAARWMTWKAAWKIDRGEDAMREAALAFRMATDTAWRVADDGVQILGGHGVIRDHLSELFFRNARTLANTPGSLLV